MCKYFDGTCNCPYRMSSVCDSPSDCEYLTERRINSSSYLEVFLWNGISLKPIPT